MAVLSTIAEDPASGRNGRFILQKRLFRFRLRIADFALSRTSSLSTARSRQKPGPGASRTIFRDAKNHRRFGLGSGPSGCPKARSRRVDAGVGPVGLPETTSGRRPKLPTAMANPRRRSRALRYSGAGGWPVGLPETTSGRRPKLPRQPWQTRAVVRARSVILALGAGPSGFPKQFSGTAKASATASLALASVVLALGSGRTGFPKQVSERRKLPRQPWQTRAVVRARSVIVALGAGPSGFPKQTSGRRLKHLPRARFRRFSAGEWPDGLPETSFRAMQSGWILDAAAAYAARSLCRNTGPDYQGRGPGQWPQWPFYQQADKGPDL